MAFKVQVGPAQIAIHQGQTVLVTEPDGQVGWPSTRGLYFRDTRLISAWAIYANGEPWDLLNGGAVAPNAARIFQTNRTFVSEDGPIAARTLGLVIVRHINGGLHEDIDITNNMNANLTQKASLGITGHPNYSGNDGSIQRFGWKAQVRSTLLMAANQMNVEMGVTNETFPNEIDQTPGCVLNPVPETVSNFTPTILTEMFPGDAERAEYFIQWMAPPSPGPTNNSTKNGKTQFTNAGCVYCHTTSFTTPATSRPGLGNITINLYSDLLVHHMGPGLADGLPQGQAGPDEFRTAPLWGIGQRLFFMHDGRTSNIVTAIEDHLSLSNGSYPASEANQSVTNFNNLSPKNQQDLVNFLRSL